MKDFHLNTAPVQEPVYHLRQFGNVTKEQLDRYMKTGDINPQPAPVQEPVCDKDPQGCWSVRCQLGKKCKNTSPTATAAQRQWVGLTDDEIRSCIASEKYAFEIVRAAEAKLKEKNT
jgi:hypothetical protein